MIDEILKELEAEKEKLDAAIAALSNGDRPKRRYNKTKTTRTMSAEARKRISMAQKRRWKEQKAQAKA